MTYALSLKSAAALALPLTLAATAPALAQGEGETSNPSLETVADEALESDTYAWDFVEGITTEVGPRQAGTEAEARGRQWAMDWLTKHGFENVADEPFEMETWVPGEPEVCVH